MKKSMTELTDSGVSVVSDVPPSATSKDARLINWLKDGSCAQTVKQEPSSKLNRKKFINMPQQPFVADPNMPPLPAPHNVSFHDSNNK